jgi:hypothetical protein
MMLTMQTWRSGSSIHSCYAARTPECLNPLDPVSLRKEFLYQHRFGDTEPLPIERHPADGLPSPAVPVRRVIIIALLAVEIGMHPRPLDALVLLRGFVRPRPIALCIPPQPGEGVCESGWRLGRGEGLAKFVRGHCFMAQQRNQRH